MSDLRTFDDIAPGEVAQAGPLEVSREAIIAFAQMYDPQPFHLDETAAANSLLDGLAASGWHTAAIGMRLFHDGFVGHVASMGSPGVEALRWSRPVRPGDALSLVCTVGSTRASGSRPDRGYVEVALDMRTAAGATVMTETCTLIVRRRGAPPASDSTRLPRPASPAVAAAPAADPMMAATFDEIVVGHEVCFGTQLFTPEVITGFAKLYDPQPFHLDAQAAKASHFGGLIASGWQTAAFWMKHYIAARRRAREAREAAGLPVAIGGPSPGFADLRWLRPVPGGEAITYGMKVTGKRKTGRGWGLVNTLGTGHAADGGLAFSFEGRLLWPTGP